MLSRCCDKLPLCWPPTQVFSVCLIGPFLCADCLIDISLSLLVLLFLLGRDNLNLYHPYLDILVTPCNFLSRHLINQNKWKHLRGWAGTRIGGKMFHIFIVSCSSFRDVIKWFILLLCFEPLLILSLKNHLVTFNFVSLLSLFYFTRITAQTVH